MDSFLVLYLLVMACLLGALYRNRRVFNFRMEILHKDINEYNALPSNDQMFYEFWKPMSAYRNKETVDGKKN